MSAFLDTAIDPDVIERARAGEDAALAAVYHAFEVPVRTLARRLVASRAVAEDLAQDVFVDVITRLHQYEGRGSFAGWVRSIAVTRCLMHLRSPWQRSRVWLMHASGADGAGSSSAGWDDMPGQAATSADSADAIDLERALAQLKPTARAVVWLHDVEGCTHAEIGALWGASASFSKSQLARAHQRLRVLLHVDGVGTPCTPITSIV
jgi:RNA polymerase sigma factor (sigma-70 family)